MMPKKVLTKIEVCFCVCAHVCMCVPRQWNCQEKACTESEKGSTQ